MVSCGGGTSSIVGSIPGSPAPLLIGTDFAGSTDHVFVMTIGNDGELKEVPGSPFTAGSEPVAVTVSGSAHLAFVANSADNSVSVFKISTTGSLSAVGPAVPSGEILPLHLALNNAGNLLIVGNGNGGSVLFQVNSTNGAISQLSVGLGYSGAAFSPDGKAIFSLYVANDDQNSTFSVDPATGATNLVFSGSGFASVVPGPIVVHPSGRFLYVPVKPGMSIPPDPNAKGGLLSFSIGPDGAWTPLAASPLDSNFTSAAIDRSGSHVYAISDVGPNVYGFNVDSTTGELTAIAGSPFSTNATGSFVTFALAFDPTGKFLFVSQPGAISSFRVAQDGSLSAVSGSPFPSGGELSSLASLQP